MLSLFGKWSTRVSGVIELTLWTSRIYFELPPTKPNCLRVHQPSSQIVYACISPQVKLFSLQLENQSKILFRRFLPFALSFQVRALGELIGDRDL